MHVLSFPVCHESCPTATYWISKVLGKTSWPVGVPTTAIEVAVVQLLCINAAHVTNKIYIMKNILFSM